MFTFFWQEKEADKRVLNVMDDISGVTHRSHAFTSFLAVTKKLANSCILISA